MWIYPTKTVAESQLFSSTLSAGIGGFEVGAKLDNVTKNFDVVVDGTIFSTTNTITLNKWHHFILHRNEGTIRVIVDGITDPTTGTDADTLSFACELIVGVLEIGGGGFCNASETNASTGKIDDFRVYDRALSFEEIKRLYHLGGDGYVEVD